ncbi:MAG: hypothetical protein ILP18_08570 [Treponema sp.]|nr:hypothetical protein [Treponema sp.]
MNEASLLIQAFLMHNSVPFTRYCHPAWIERSQWRTSLKKMNVTSTPVKSILACDGSGDKLLMGIFPELDADEHTLLGAMPPAVFLTAPQEEEVLSSLRCEKRLLSPLSLIFRMEGNTRLYIPENLELCEYLSFPCADATETVVLSMLDFLGSFVPAAGISVKHVQACS